MASFKVGQRVKAVLAGPFCGAVAVAAEGHRPRAYRYRI